ncbi:MAG: sensor domain-containing diguanylate cyclase [Campylobacterota bacterium]
MKLSDITAKAIFSVAFISVLFTFLIAIIFQFNNFQKETNRIKDDYLKIKKEQIKTEVSKVYNRINQKEKNILNKIKSNLKDEVLSAYKTALNIYEDNKNRLTDEEIKYLILTTLKNKSFSNNRLYISINENNKKESDKISFTKKFEPFNWDIVIKESVENIEKITKEEILKEIAQIRFGKNGYIYVNRIDKKALVFDGNYLKEPTDYKNNELFEKQLNAINSDNKYFYYNFKKLNSNEEVKKVGYVKYYEKFNWIIGSGVYIDDINEEIELRTNTHESMVLKQILTLLILLILLTIFIYFISKKLSKYLKNNIDNLLVSFKYASKNFKPINTTKLDFVEFEVLANSLNETLEARNKIVKKVEYLSITDDLTNLYNRRHFNEVIENEINRAKRESHSIAFLMIDIDYFKNYNDTYGHQEGDTTLVKIAQVLQDNSNRANDFAFRLGGEEFAILTTNKTAKEVEDYANKIRNEIENLKITHEQNPVSKYLTCSIGIIIKEPNSIPSSTKLYKLADDALYMAKDKGRNTTIVLNSFK